jgi:hypothetical protein
MSSESAAQLCAQTARETEFTVRKVSDFVDGTKLARMVHARDIAVLVLKQSLTALKRNACLQRHAIVQIIDTQLSRLSM